jgi:hypothetical protein
MARVSAAVPAAAAERAPAPGAQRATPAARRQHHAGCAEEDGAGGQGADGQQVQRAAGAIDIVNRLGQLGHQAGEGEDDLRHQHDTADDHTQDEHRIHGQPRSGKASRKATAGIQYTLPRAAEELRAGTVRDAYESQPVPERIP